MNISALDQAFLAEAREPSMSVRNRKAVAKVVHSEQRRANSDQLGLFDVRHECTTATEKAVPISRSSSSAIFGRTRTRPGESIDNTASEVYRLRDLMRIFKYADVNSFWDWRRRVEQHGFPAPLPGCSRPLKWDRQQVDAWRRGGVARSRELRNERLALANAKDVIALARERLRRKAMSRM